MTNRLKWSIKTPFVEKSGTLAAGSSDTDVMKAIDSLVYTLQHYKETILNEAKKEHVVDGITVPDKVWYNGPNAIIYYVHEQKEKKDGGKA